jgi:hypothetical protein
MISYINHYHSVYSGNIKIAEPIATQNLKTLLLAIKNPRQSTIELIQSIRKETDEGKRALLKQRLNGYTPCVICTDKRRYSNIMEFSGLLALDFDKLESIDYAKEFKEFLFSEYPFIYSTWLSSSGKGVRALVHIPKVESVDEFKLYYSAIESQEMMQFDGYDTAPKNPVLPLFQSYDPDLLYRTTAEQWTEKAESIKQPVYKPMVLPDISDKDVMQIMRAIKSAIDQINDYGHPRLRAASFTLGGYVGSGYMLYNQAYEYMCDLIDSNAYLSKKSNTYKRTAKEMIQKGINQPLYLR